ncbi:acylphosphatase [Candidatus Amarobacter glycogenicus]|uniref:acylphosphatase n=2 Tax=Candidatus Amarobacter glycogenicus TaxID=3140699 RepID=UPI0031CCC030
MALSPGPPLHPELRPADTFIMAKLDVYIPERHRIVIHGKVQGVGFRLWLRNVASSLSLVGSCRQLPDGACEAIVQGEKTLLKQFIVACKRGPAEAVVERIERESLAVDPSLGDFHVER